MIKYDKVYLLEFILTYCKLWLSSFWRFSWKAASAKSSTSLNAIYIGTFINTLVQIHASLIKSCSKAFEKPYTTIFRKK